MRILFNLVFVLLTISSFGQLTEKKIYDSKRNLSFIKYYKNGVLVREVEYHIGVKKSEQNFDSFGRPFGAQIEYYNNGKIKDSLYLLGIESIPANLISDSSDKDLYIDVNTGKSTRYYENGKIKSVGYIVNAMRIGYWLFYEEKGGLKTSEFYKCLTNDEIP